MLPIDHSNMITDQQSHTMTLCTTYYDKNECDTMYWYWRIGGVCLSLLLVMICVLSKMKDNWIKLLLFYMMVDLIIKPILLNTIHEEFNTSAINDE